ncbi:MAG TPA: hypothetical protein VH331_09995 [Allosphingosinicella sp.]|jgi:hypothetical protein|nr:hypothetical protein [Allosphingosinicella sp.]
MRAAASAAFLLLVGCGSSDAGQHGQGSAAASAPGLECATDGASDYGTSCTIERTGAILTIRSPTGSFRRLRVANGRVAAADGAEPARLLGGDDKRVNVAIGGDRYLIPREALR